MRNIPVDVLSADAALDGFKLVIAPAMLMLNEARASRLRLFVENGGHLVLTVRSGMKDDTNALLPMRQPGMLAEIAGVEVEDYYALQEAVPVVGEDFRGESRIWAERLKVRDAEKTRIIARYGASNGWLDGQAAVTCHPFGKGCVTYVGAYLDDASQQKLLDDILLSAGVQPLMELPSGVEIRQRVRADGRQIFIILNHERTEKQVTLPWQAHEHLHGRDIQDFQLEPYGVAVVTRIE